MRRNDQKVVRKIVDNRITKSATAIVHSIDINRVNITLGNTSTLVRGVEVIGDAKKLTEGALVPLTWREGRPIVLQTVRDTNSLLATSDSQAKIGQYPKSVTLEIPTAYMYSAAANLWKINTSQYYEGWWEYLGAANDYLEWTFLIDAGSYLMTVLCLTASRFGAYQIYLDGVFLDDQDLYSASTVYNVSWDVPMTIPVGGVHVVRLVCSGKNATSTNYTLAADWITICPV
jgi:hypothetical protein